MHTLGQTRSASHRDHLLHTPDAFVRVSLPHIERGAAIVHTSPSGGAAFTQYTAELDPGGVLAPASQQRFLYVLEGAADLVDTAAAHHLTPRDYAYLPPQSTHRLTATTPCRIAVVEKLYHPLANIEPPAPFLGHEDAIPSTALMGDPGLQVRQLLPDHPAFDFAVNTMTYQPGAALSQVEVHVMEHGLLMLEGGGIYRLGERWYSVAAGDFIWMAPFCPQWFGAIGKEPARYLIYKDSNRLAPQPPPE